MKNYIEILTERMANEGYENDYIKLVVNYADNLIKNDLPVIFDITHLSMYLDEQEGNLRKILKNSGAFYLSTKLSTKIKSKGNKIRDLYIPNEKLKKIQTWILYRILYKVEVQDCVKGFKLGNSIVDNALPHVNKKYVLNLDFKNFFESINEKQLNSVFLSIGYNRIVAEALSKLCSYNGFLPQGSPSSPYLSNLVCRDLDANIMEYVECKNITYTRYADDLTFSTDENLEGLLSRLEEIIVNESFKINEKKTRIQCRNQRQLVTGLVVNKKVNVPREYIRELRSEIYYCKKFSVSGHMERKGIFYSNYKHHLYGKAFYIKMVDQKKGEKFLKELDEINWQY